MCSMRLSEANDRVINARLAVVVSLGASSIDEMSMATAALLIGIRLAFKHPEYAAWLAERREAMPHMDGAIEGLVRLHPAEAVS